MPLFRRRRQQPVFTGVTETAPAAARPCSEGGCVNLNALPCAYVDRRRRPCGTAWCPDHGTVIDGRVYCRRHAGVLDAIRGGQDSEALPDVDNRAPSLVGWIARDLDDEVRACLLQGPFADPKAELITDPVRLVLAGPDRHRTWERGWKLAVHTGFTAKVLVQVAEERDTEVIVRVGNNVAAQLVPPWIERRRSGVEVTDETDAAQRRDFYRSLALTVARALYDEKQLRIERGLE